jgi:acetyltransferase-like isoleucine patch superfamily enzyme
MVEKPVLRPLVWLVYGRSRTRLDSFSPLTILQYAFFQKVMRINGGVPWPVHFTSFVGAWGRVTKCGISEPLGFSPGCYIQALNGIVLGVNVVIGPNVSIVSANHDPADYDRHVAARPIRIGDNVWIGAHSVILPGVEIGSNVIIGAGSVVNEDIPSDSVAVGNPCRVVSKKPPYRGESSRSPS